ncbi:MAG: TadE/TadG family type IV pilus assembly protein [Bacillota bacterium]|nr:TadE/TadG family type IV pilus assembly protein [Bacillota bacterium]
MFWRIIIKSIKNEKGQAVVEFAIVLPILILIIGGMIDFSWIYSNQNIIDNCAREGARYAIVHATDTNVTTEITNYTKSIAPTSLADSLNVQVEFSNTYSHRAGNVKITVSSDVNVLTPIAGVFTDGQKLNLSSSCTMKVE